MTKGKLYSLFISLIILALAAAFVVTPKGTSIAGITNPVDYKFGLDLQGGTQLVYEGDLSEISENREDEAMESLRGALERRIMSRSGGGLGVNEPLLQLSGGNRLIVELPGVSDPEQAKDVIGQTPFLEFRTLSPDNLGQGISENPEDWASTGLTGKNLDHASVEFDPNTGQPIISLTFDAEGARLFEEITAQHTGEPLAVFLDGQLLQAPVVQTRIVGGQAVITGGFSLDEAKTIVSRLNSGALPVPIKLVSETTVGATLGALSLNDSVTAGIIGLLAVMLFMILFYRLPGLLAATALAMYAVFSLAIFKLLPVTLTLAGIAGFILSIGMAIDANILIFERIKEELRDGKEVHRAVHDGFTRAWAAIRDGNFSTLITTFILGYFGTSIIRAFAITLSIGVILSMFTAITVTRTFLLVFIGKGKSFAAHPWLYGLHSYQTSKE